ncbi:MAG: RsmE family RNA methyltransferase, partial [Ruminococcus sp.]|nr:RsmE family RNA methyltransferase [Ruminococcus sp.]
MPHFFVDEEIESSEYSLFGEDGRHIAKSLRMKQGENLTLCSPSGTVHNCVVEKVEGDFVGVRILSSEQSEAEPSVKVTLYQALPKGDKMEFIIQKAVEIGVTEIVPVISSRCVSRPDQKSLSKKLLRWQKIAKQAAMQSGRGIVP